MKRFIIVKSSDNTYVYDRKKKKGYKQIGEEFVGMKVNSEISFSKTVVYIDDVYESDKLPNGFKWLI